MKNGRLTLLFSLPRKDLKRWFQCDCGNLHLTRLDSVKQGRTKSCGCFSSEKSRERLTKHGLSCTKEYECWTAMKQRCLNSNHPAFKWYGKRGIRICKRWLVFENFILDMGKCPKGLTLERKDNNEGYNPFNCEWATWFRQRRNTRRNKIKL